MHSEEVDNGDGDGGHDYGCASAVGDVEAPPSFTRPNITWMRYRGRPPPRGECESFSPHAGPGVRIVEALTDYASVPRTNPKPLNRALPDSLSPPRSGRCITLSPSCCCSLISARSDGARHDPLSALMPKPLHAAPHRLLHHQDREQYGLPFIGECSSTHRWSARPQASQTGSIPLQHRKANRRCP